MTAFFRVLLQLSRLSVNDGNLTVDVATKKSQRTCSERIREFYQQTLENLTVRDRNFPVKISRYLSSSLATPGYNSASATETPKNDALKGLLLSLPAKMPFSRVHI